MAGNSQRRGAMRSSSKKGPQVGSGGQRRRGLEGKGPPPKAADRPHHKAHKLAKRLRAGTVWINTHNWGDAAFPFGGYKQSGWGREVGKEVMAHYTETKAGGARPV